MVRVGASIGGEEGDELVGERVEMVSRTAGSGAGMAIGVPMLS
jgi:hypothetical protein